MHSGRFGHLRLKIRLRTQIIFLLTMFIKDNIIKQSSNYPSDTRLLKEKKSPESGGRGPLPPPTPPKSAFVIHVIFMLRCTFSMVFIRKGTRFVSKQDQSQSHVHLEARVLSS